MLDAPAEVWDDVRGVFAGSEVDTGRISFQYGITNSELILTGLSNSTTLVLVVVGIIGVFSQVADFVSQMAGEAGGAVAEVLADAGLALFGQQPHRPYRCRAHRVVPVRVGDVGARYLHLLRRLQGAPSR